MPGNSHKGSRFLPELLSRSRLRFFLSFLPFLLFFSLELFFRLRLRESESESSASEEEGECPSRRRLLVLVPEPLASRLLFLSFFSCFWAAASWAAALAFCSALVFSQSFRPGWVAGSFSAALYISIVGSYLR